MHTAALLRGDGHVVCDRCQVADSALPRLRGLMGRRTLEPGEGLLLRPANAIHTGFMRFAIDAVFLDRQLRVVDVVPQIRPWRLAGRRRARAVVELAAGEVERCGIEPEMQLRLEKAA